MELQLKENLRRKLYKISFCQVQYCFPSFTRRIKRSFLWNSVCTQSKLDTIKVVDWTWLLSAETWDSPVRLCLISTARQRFQKYGKQNEKYIIGILGITNLKITSFRWNMRLIWSNMLDHHCRTKVSKIWGKYNELKTNTQQKYSFCLKQLWNYFPPKIQDLPGFS